MSTLTEYAIAEGHDNTAGYETVASFLSVHVTSAGTFEWGIARVPLDGPTRDMGTGRFEWALSAGLTPDDIDYIMSNFLNDERSGEVTVSTRLNNGDWVDVNAVLELPRTFTLQGIRYGTPVLTFTQAEIIS